MIIQSQSKIDEYYDALISRDPSYIGIFYVGVVTTSVFCISTCRARKPKKKNVKFYKNFSDALRSGFRPCKICCPTENSFETPEQVKKAIQLIKDHPKEKITDTILKINSLSPEMIRRWFKSNYGLTYHSYQRMYRVNNAYKELKDGSSTTSTAFNQGYDSLSGFGYTFKKITGNSPRKVKSYNSILINRISSPLGPLLVCATENGICLLEFTDRKMIETELRELQKYFKAHILVGENDHIKLLRKELKEYFNGQLKKFKVALDAPGTEFQKKAWKALAEIKYGETGTYKLQAIKLSNPKAVRAVARANGANRIAIVLPCHRIIGSDGKLTGYGGGLERKKWLLDFEKKMS